jgi:O-methyltransferase
MNPRILQKWITGAAYNYADGLIWPEPKYHSLRMWVWRVAVKLGYSKTNRLRRDGECWPAQALTMIGEKRAENILDMVEMALQTSVPGCFVDCGVWRGGSTILMASATMHAPFPLRRVFCCDTFDGFPPEDAAADGVMCPTALKVSQHEVEDNFRKCDVPMGCVTFLRGKVQDTLKAINEPVAMLRVDVDNYEATLACLETLYTRIPVDGVVIIDDYGDKSYKCRSAVDFFRTKNNIREPLVWIDNAGVYWIKEA